MLEEKRKKDRFKVLVGVLALTAVFVGMYIGLNNIAFGLATDYLGTDASYEKIDVDVMEFAENDWFAELVHLESMPHIITNRMNNLYVNQVLLLDLTTGELMATYEFDAYEIVKQVWDLGNGYYAAWVGYEPLCDRERRREWILGDWSEEMPDSDFRTPEELNFRLVIFDSELNPIDVLTYTEQLSTNLTWWSNVVRYVDGELFIYNFVPSVGFDMMYFGWDTDLELPWNFQRMNAHTGETEVLFRAEEDVPLYEFIEDNQILVSSFVYLYDGTSFGILDIESGEMRFSEKNAFSSDGIILTESPRVMFNERFLHWYWDRSNVRNEIILLNLEDMSTEVIQLAAGDSFWARPCLKENYIVTLNEVDSVFRKYDLNGNLVAETDIIIPFDFDNFDFEIFPITENIYAIHIHTSMFVGGRHIQIINLDGDIQVVTSDDLVFDPLDRVEMMRLRIPDSHHLSEEDARDIAIQWIYEEFGIIMEAELVMDMLMDFWHEDNSERGQAFWTGFLQVRRQSYDEFDPDNSYLYWEIGNVLHSIEFSIDGVTGERFAISDGSSDHKIEIDLEHMQLTVIDISVSQAASSPSSFIEAQSYHLSIEEAAIQIAETADEAFGANLDGHIIANMRLVHHVSDRVVWAATVINEDESFVEGVETLFFATVDAITGEVYLVDVRESIGQGMNQRHPVDIEMILNDIQFTVSYLRFGGSQPTDLSVGEVAELAANAIYEAFGVSLDGYYMQILFWGEQQAQAVPTVTVTVRREHPDITEGQYLYLFQLFLNAETGELGSETRDLRDIANPQ